MRLLCSIGVLALAAVIACGGGGSDPNPMGPNDDQNPGTPSASANVTMQGSDDAYGTRTFRFVPGAVSIVRGGTVTWTNSSAELHNVTFEGSGAPAHIGDHASGSSSRTFNSTGTFGYECTNHPGMTGTVTVQ